MAGPESSRANANDNLKALVLDKIEALRPKLLDLTARNPLIRVRLSRSSNSYVRVVDELPDVLFFRLTEGSSMVFAALPPLDDEPMDEQTKVFRDALSVWQQTDEAFRKASEALDPNAADYLDHLSKLERQLRDQVREELGMPARSTGKDPASLTSHAKSHGITPSHDLPMPSPDSQNDRHLDDQIQTLQLPRDLERRMNAILSKARTWRQETGINVMQAAFGILEWSDPNSRDTNMSPLIVLPVGIQARKSARGAEYSVAGLGEIAETNGVLRERLKRDYGLDLPVYHSGSVEDYLDKVAKLAPAIPVWRVRRQIVFGIFPSSRLAMYHDLDTTKVDFFDNEIIRSLLAGTNAGEDSPFAPEHDVDAIDENGELPLTVMDADSSQLSVLVDIAREKNLAVEGPPGTGKSQTIVNAIAGALASGKKVLFVAEKLAALDVVRSRLKAVGLGEFILPLQASRSSREEVIASLRSRLDLRNLSSPRDFEAKQDQLRKTRRDLAEYIDVLSEEFGSTELTVHQILGNAIATSDKLKKLPAEVRDTELVPDLAFDKVCQSEVHECFVEFETAQQDAFAGQDAWVGVTRTALAPFQADEILEIALETVPVVDKLADGVNQFTKLGLPLDMELQEMMTLKDAVADFLGNVSAQEASNHASLINKECAGKLRELIEYRNEHARAKEVLALVLSESDYANLVAKLQTLIEICKAERLEKPLPELIDAKAERRRDLIKFITTLKTRIQEFTQYHPPALNWTLRAFQTARELLSNTPRDVLSLRGNDFVDASEIQVLKAQIAEGRQLKEHRQRISTSFNLEYEISISDIQQDLQVLRSAGPLSFVSGDVRKAKTRYFSVSKNPRFKRDVAIAGLRRLLEFLTQEARFSSDPRNTVLFGLHFRGLDTDFDLFDNLLAYLSDVDEAFPQPGDREVRSFLKTADLDLLAALPDLGGMREDKAYADLDTVLRQEQARASQAQQVRSRLVDAASALKDPASVEAGQLDNLLRQVEALRELEQRCGGLSASLGVRNDWSSERSEQLAHLVSFIERIPGSDSIVEPVRSCAMKGELGAIPDALASFLDALEVADKRMDKLADLTGLDLPSPRFDPAEMHNWLTAASQDLTGLFAHVRVARAKEKINELGFSEFLDLLLEVCPEQVEVAAVADALVAHYLARLVYNKHLGILTAYSGEKLRSLRQRLSSLDRELITLARDKLRAELVQIARPPQGNGVGRKSDYTDMALIMNEVEKKKRFLPVRDLMHKAGRAMLELKPCWMMSPQAVAQYIQKGSLEFDLCIIDEASQMPPEDALGALYRSRRAVVVGDTNQLPPSDFFKMILDGDGADDGADDNVLEESVLELAKSAFRPTRRLRWHYRSRHEGLISFSNRHIYDDDLIVFPSPHDARADMGVSLHQVEGRYKRSLNLDETNVVVDAVLNFMHKHPDRSLGVVTLNKPQADHIRELLENEAFPEDNRARRYVEHWEEARDGLESFFVKNLENVQGDERDVIFISTVYGPEEIGGPVMQRFGPINGIAGQRRLNVLFSRAKEQIVTFSSMTAADIVANEHGNKGAWMLKRWLEYSATGRLAAGKTTSRPPDSEFERYVIDQVNAIGCEAVPQVGVAGYFIDIGVKHPDWSHGFVLGIECDGASYHSGKSARDRDRLRQEVLEQLGWKLHRIWSTDWFNDPGREVNILRQVIFTQLEHLKATGPPRAIMPKVDDVPAAQPELALGNIPCDKAEPESMTKMLSTEADSASQSYEGFNLGSSDSTKRVQIGDTVRIRYLTHGKDVLQVTISKEGNDPSKGMIGYAMPLAQTVLDAEEGDEIEVLNGSYLRTAVIEKVIKVNAMN